MRNFVEEREWNKFHIPRNVLLALTAEVGEVCELF
jgi:dCTP diphosphatase